MILSILICTIESRFDKFITLYEELLRQKYKWYFLEGNSDWEIEIIFDKDNKEKSIGKKRQDLIERSKGDHVVFIDDDDDISDDYISKICIELADNDPDCIGFKIQCDMEGKKEMAIASNIYHDWCENKDGYKYCRTPYHKTPVKREIALQIGYKDMRFGEDYDYSKRLKESGLIKSEVFIDEVMYYYNFKYEDPKIKYGINNQALYYKRQ